MNRTLWLGGLALSGALLAASIGVGAEPRHGAAPVLRRILGPVATLAAGVQWVRVDEAIRRGEYARAYARAETALELDPEDPAGWILLGHHLLFERASPGREPDPSARARWIHAGLAVLERGERESRDPGEIWFEHGIALAFLGSLADEDRAWPGSAPEAWRLAAEAFDAAAAHGIPRAARAAALARGR